MSSNKQWSSLIRFKDTNGEVKFGEPKDDLKAATVWEGSSIFDVVPSDKEVEVAEVSKKTFSTTLQLVLTSDD